MEHKKTNNISIYFLLSVLLVCLVFLICGCSNDKASEEKPYELKFAHHEPANSDKGKMFQAWANEVNAASNGKLNITVYPSSTLGSVVDGMNMVNNGICDILWSFTGFFNKEFTATDVISLPMLGFENTVHTVDAFWELYNQRPEIQKEFEGLKVLALYAHPPAVLGTDKKVTCVDDIKGLKVRVPTGPATQVIKEWGAIPMTIPTPDIYQSLEKGVINGYVFDWAGIPGFKLQEPTKYFLDIKLYAGPMFIVINEKKWTALPQDLQKIIEEHSYRKLSMTIAENQDQVVSAFIALMQKEGKTVIFPDEKQLAGFKVAADKVVKQWIAEMNAKGVDGQGLYDAARAVVDKYKK